jgi:hypothetical protein
MGTLKVEYAASDLEQTVLSNSRLRPDAVKQSLSFSKLIRIDGNALI